MNRIDGKVCVVTGGSQGLGAAIARLFAKAGAHGLVICARSEVKDCCDCTFSYETIVHFGIYISYHIHIQNYNALFCYYIYSFYA